MVYNTHLGDEPGLDQPKPCHTPLIEWGHLLRREVLMNSSWNFTSKPSGSSYSWEGLGELHEDSFLEEAYEDRTDLYEEWGWDDPTDYDD